MLPGDAHVAQGLVQDCFVRLAGKLVTPQDPPAYLRRMVVGAAHSHHRRLRVRRDRAGDEARTLDADIDTSPDGADGRAERERLMAALATLRARQREAVVLRHWLDLAEQECATQLGCSVSTVTSLASSGRTTASASEPPTSSSPAARPVRRWRAP